MCSTTPVALSTGRERRRASGEGGEHRVDDVGGGEVGRADPVLGGGHGAAHGIRPDRAGGGPHARVGEHGVGARHGPARVVLRLVGGHTGLPRTLAEADGNRTRQAEVLGFTGVEDREGHQAPVRLRR